VIFVEAQVLDLGSHGAVQDQDALAGCGFKRRQDCRSVAQMLHLSRRSIHIKKALYGPKGSGIDRRVKLDFINI
jgi:hypothetical protein